jgi:hypothetical protein
VRLRINTSIVQLGCRKQIPGIAGYVQRALDAPQRLAEAFQLTDLKESH